MLLFVLGIETGLGTGRYLFEGLNLEWRCDIVDLRS